MGNASHGREVSPPPGFDRKISILGTDLKLRYFWTLKEKPSGTGLDGYLHPNGRQIWLAVYGRTIASPMRYSTNLFTGHCAITQRN